ncbi:MAG: BamA/TamA family outer membrane protein [Candidatus Latescibacterota bacterium]
MRADVQLDTRNSVGDPDRGWFINAYAERAGGVLGGDFRFKRYLLDLRRYQPMGPGTRLDLRLRRGTAKGDLPRQYVYRLGGFGSVSVPLQGIRRGPAPSCSTLITGRIVTGRTARPSRTWDYVFSSTLAPPGSPRTGPILSLDSEIWPWA